MVHRSPCYVGFIQPIEYYGSLNGLNIEEAFPSGNASLISSKMLVPHRMFPIGIPSDAPIP